MTAFFDILIGGVFHAAVLFLVAAGLQLVFGVQKIVNLACGSFYALGAYFGISSVNWAIATGLPPVVSGLAVFRDFLTDGETGVVFDHRAADGERRGDSSFVQCVALVARHETLCRDRMSAQCSAEGP